MLIFAMVLAVQEPVRVDPAQAALTAAEASRIANATGLEAEEAAAAAARAAVHPNIYFAGGNSDEHEDACWSLAYAHAKIEEQVVAVQAVDELQDQPFIADVLAVSYRLDLEFARDRISSALDKLCNGLRFSENVEPRSSRP